MQSYVNSQKIDAITQVLAIAPEMQVNPTKEPHPLLQGAPLKSPEN